jgi:hypothetical protein
MHAIGDAGGDFVCARHKSRQTRRKFGGRRAVVWRAARRIAPLCVDAAD